jgi:hypothetical protein
MLRKVLIYFVLFGLITMLVGCGKSTSTLAPAKILDTNYSFQGNNPVKVKPGEQFTVNFILTNNGEVPVVALNIRFDKIQNVDNIIPDETFGKVQFIPQLGKRVLTSKYINVNKGNSISSKFDMVINTPGTYQVELNPDVLAGDWKFPGTWIMTVIVEDSPEAQAKHKQQAELQQKRAAVIDLQDKINSIDVEMGKLKQEIAGFSKLIENHQIRIGDMEALRDQAVMKKSNIKPGNGLSQADYDRPIREFENGIKNAKDEVDKLQGKIAQDQQRLETLGTQKDSLLQQKQGIEKTIVK